jgi:hypothetical protein
VRPRAEPGRRNSPHCQTQPNQTPPLPRSREPFEVDAGVSDWALLAAFWGVRRRGRRPVLNQGRRSCALEVRDGRHPAIDVRVFPGLGSQHMRRKRRALPKVVPSSPDSLGDSAESASPGVAPHKAGRDSPSALTPPMRSHSRRLTRSNSGMESSWIESKRSRLSETAAPCGLLCEMARRSTLG